MKRNINFLLLSLLAIILTFPLTACSSSNTVNVENVVGGTITSSVTSAKEGEIVTLSNVPNDGYYFISYIVDGTETTENEFVMPDGEVKVSAKFGLLTYSITYHLGENETHSNPKTYNVQSQFELTDAEKEGYEFLGWYNSTSDTATKITQISAGTTGQINLYARFAPKNYNIIYHLDGGENSPSNPTSYNILSETYILEKASKENAIFKGWYLSPDFSGNQIYEIDGSYSGNLDIYAKFVTDLVDEDGYKIIKTVVDFKEIVGKSSSSNDKFRLANDLENVGELTVSSTYSPFRGEFDGQNYTISGIVLNDCLSKRIGLFNCIEGATIKNLFISYEINVNLITISGTSYPMIGGLIAEAKGDCNIINCHSTNSKITNAVNINSKIYVGGLVGEASNSTMFYQCSVSDLYLHINSEQHIRAGGICGNGGSFNQCYVSVNNDLFIGIINSSSLYFGGIVGYLPNNCIILNSYVDLQKIGRLYANSSVGNSDLYLGGLVGRAENATISSSYVSANSIVAKSWNTNSNFYVGSLVGYASYCNLKDCFAYICVDRKNISCEGYFNDESEISKYVHIGYSVGYNLNSTMSNILVDNSIQIEIKLNGLSNKEANIEIINNLLLDRNYLSLIFSQYLLNNSVLNWDTNIWTFEEQDGILPKLTYTI